jgi:hypothetical protein
MEPSFCALAWAGEARGFAVMKIASRADKGSWAKLSVIHIDSSQHHIQTLGLLQTPLLILRWFGLL